MSFADRRTSALAFAFNKDLISSMIIAPPGVDRPVLVACSAH